MPTTGNQHSELVSESGFLTSHEFSCRPHAPSTCLSAYASSRVDRAFMQHQISVLHSQEQGPYDVCAAALNAPALCARCCCSVLRLLHSVRISNGYHGRVIFCGRAPSVSPCCRGGPRSHIQEIRPSAGNIRFRPQRGARTLIWLEVSFNAASSNGSSTQPRATDGLDRPGDWSAAPNSVQPPAGHNSLGSFSGQLLPTTSASAPTRESSNSRGPRTPSPGRACHPSSHRRQPEG